MFEACIAALLIAGLIYLLLSVPEWIRKETIDPPVTVCHRGEQLLDEMRRELGPLPTHAESCVIGIDLDFSDPDVIPKVEEAVRIVMRDSEVETADQRLDRLVNTAG